MDRTHRETYFKLSTRIIDHGQREPVPEEVTTSGSIICKCNAFIQQGRGEQKWSFPLAIWPNRNFYSDLTRNFLLQSDRGNNYILVAYHYDANNILTTPR